MPGSLTFRGESSTPDCRIRLLLNLQGQSGSTERHGRKKIPSVKGGVDLHRTLPIWYALASTARASEVAKPSRRVPQSVISLYHLRG